MRLLLLALIGLIVLSNILKPNIPDPDAATHGIMAYHRNIGGSM